MPSCHTVSARFLALAATLFFFASPQPARPADAEARYGTAPALVEGTWRYRWGDSPTNATGEFNWVREPGVEGWLPLTRGIDLPDRRDRNILWVRLVLPTGDWADPALEFENVSLSFEVISATGAQLYSAGQVRPDSAPRVGHWGRHIIPLPASLLGQPVFVRIQSIAGQPIGISGNVWIGARGDLLTRLVQRGSSAFVVGALLLLIGVVAMLLALFLRDQQVWVPFGLTLLSAGTLILGMSGLHDFFYFAPRAWRLLLFIASVSMAPNLVAFVALTLLGAPGPRLRWVIRVLFGFAIFFSLVVIVNLEASSYLSFASVSAFLTGTVLSIGIAASEIRKGNREAGVFLAGMLVLFLAGAHDSLVVVGANTSNTFLLHWGFLGLTISLGAVLGLRFSRISRQVAARSVEAEQQNHALRQAHERMKAGAEELLSVVQRLRETSRRQAEVLQQQATALHETQVTATEIRETSKLAAEKSNLVAAASAQITEAGQRTEAAVEIGLGTIGEIGTQVTEITRRINALQTRTREIAGIVETVKGLAAQSNMLALNAAIEASRAGDAGKGFSVVAREVRSLADQSIQATARIREILGGLGENIDQLSHLGDRSEATVQTSLEQLRTTGTELRQIASVTRDTTNGVRQISAAVAQQNAGIAQIFTAVNDLSGQMQDALVRLREAEDATASVRQVAEALSEKTQVRSAA